jgi:hypothetical protein
MKALIATAFGVMALGGVLVANAGRPVSATPATDASPTQNRATLVSCGEGRQAMIWTDPTGSAAQRVECVPQDAALAGAVPVAYPGAHFAGQQFVAPGTVPQVVAPVVQERVVYRDPVVASSPRRTSSPRTYSSAPSRVRDEREAQTRSWKKSAVIIGGSTAAGAGVGAVLDGKSGAKKGAVVGLLGGTVYDIATRNKK